LTGEFDHIHDLIGKAALKMSLDQAEEVERRILNGENDFEVPYLPGRPGDSRTLRYTVPKFRRAPRNRLRIEMARREHRGLDPFPRWADPTLWFVGGLFLLAVADNLGWLPHLLVLALACAGAFGLVLFTRWKLARRNKGPFTRAAEAEDRAALAEKRVEEERLKCADILVKLQADLLKMQMTETRAHAREVLDTAGQMVEKAFKDLVPKRWWDQLAEADARAEAEGKS